MFKHKLYKCESTCLGIIGFILVIFNSYNTIKVQIWGLQRSVTVMGTFHLLMVLVLKMFLSVGVCVCGSFTVSYIHSKKTTES